MIVSALHRPFPWISHPCLTTQKIGDFPNKTTHMEKSISILIQEMQQVIQINGLLQGGFLRVNQNRQSFAGGGKNEFGCENKRCKVTDNDNYCSNTQVCGNNLHT